MNQIDKLSNFIMSEVSGEPSLSEGAGDCAIRIIKELQLDVKRQFKQVHDRLEVKYMSAKKNLENNPDKCGGKLYIEGFMSGLIDGMALTGEARSVCMDSSDNNIASTSFNDGMTDSHKGLTADVVPQKSCQTC